MTRTETLAEGVTLHHADCRELLPALGTLDHVITDPPYEHHTHERGGNVRRTDGGPELAIIPFASVENIRREVAAKMVAASNGWLLVFTTAEGVTPWRDAIEAAGARYKRACVWIKPDSAPQFNGQGPAAGFENVVAAWCGSGHSRWNGGGRRGVFTHQVNPPSRIPEGKGGHPTEKPLALMCELVTLFTDPGQTICDPFMGSGSTGVAAVKLGRRFVGIENDCKWFDLACRRISVALTQCDFFVEPPTPMKQARLNFAEG
jgi:site-specific DNA-methyltransferase (adenine-specific)